MASGDLCTLADVKAFMQHVEEDDSDKDALVEQLITRASTALSRWAEREFVPTASAARTFTYNGSGILSLNPYDLRTVTSISVGSETETPSELEATEYRLRPKPAPYGTYKWLVLPEGAEESEVTITGSWGFAAIPADVVHVAVLTVSTWLRQDVYTSPSEFADGGATAIGLPGAAKNLLSLYRGTRVG